MSLAELLEVKALVVMSVRGCVYLREAEGKSIIILQMIIQMPCGIHPFVNYYQICLKMGLHQGTWNVFTTLLPENIGIFGKTLQGLWTVSDLSRGL